MNYELFSRVALNSNIENTIFEKGDIVTIVEIVNPIKNSDERGYFLEMFDVLRNSIDLILVEESQLQTLLENNILHLRKLEFVS